MAASKMSSRGRAVPALFAVAALAVLHNFASLTFSALAPVQPKRPLSPYMLWLMENRANIADKLGTKNVVDVARAAGEKWKKVAKQSKKTYEKRATELKDIYQGEKAKFIEDGGVYQAKKSKNGTNAKAKKDPNMPKRPSTTFMLWLNDNRAGIAAKMPEGSNMVTDVAKEAGKMWAQVTAKGRKKYETLYGKNKEAYFKTLVEYQATLEQTA